MRDLRTEEAKTESIARYEKWSADLKTSADERAVLREKIWGVLPWQPIETCPFKTYENQTILVMNGKSTACAFITKRFGRPMRWSKPPEMVMTDHGLSYEGGELVEIEAPDWWFEWEMEDCGGSMNYAGGHETGRDEVKFVATHWLPMPVSCRIEHR